jgi:hypothetical protein
MLGDVALNDASVLGLSHSFWQVAVEGDEAALQAAIDTGNPELASSVALIVLDQVGDPPFGRVFDDRELLPSTVSPSHYDLWCVYGHSPRWCALDTKVISTA